MRRKALLLSIGILTMAGMQPGAEVPLAFVHSIGLPHVEGRIDHLAFDAARQRLFVAALGNNTVEVLDAKAGVHFKSLAGFREPQGIAVVADTRTVAVANGQGEGLALLSADDLRPAQTISLGDDSDNVRYDSAARRIYVGYGAGAIAAIDAIGRKRAGEAQLTGHPESFQLERSGTRIFANVPTAHQIAVIDRSVMKVMATWPVRAAVSNFPMALDEADRRLFIGCRQPARVLVYDSANGTQVASADIVGDTDDLFYDAKRKRLYVSGGDGFIDVFQHEDADRLVRIARVPTAAGARTSLFVPDQDRLYLAVPHRGRQIAEIRVYEPH